MAGCADVVPAFGNDHEKARMSASQAFGGLATSFAPNRYDGRYTRARTRFSANFLAPGALWADTSLWSATVGAERQLHSRAVFTGSSYDQVALPGPPPLPVVPGESRHRMTLTKRDDDRYQWDARVEWALGAGTVPSFERLVGLLALGASGGQPRAAWTTGLPRSTRAFGKLFAVDTVRADRAANGAALVTYVVRFVPGRARGEFPELAGFVEKFIVASSWDLDVSDARGARWMETSVHDGVARVRLRVSPQGALLPLFGPPGPLPSQLLLTGSIYARGSWAGVGMQKVAADLLLQREGPRRGLTLRWHTEPSWQFPFSADRLISGALRAPFEGDGIVVEFGVEDAPQGQLLLVRRFAGQVRESRLVRWMGALAGSVFGAWNGTTEPDAHRFLSECLGALRDDLRAGGP